MSLRNPEFPKNQLGLKNGTCLVVTNPIVTLELGLPPGKEIVIGYDGKYIRYRNFTWGTNQLCNEIRAGYWKIVKLAITWHQNPLRYLKFKLFC